MHYAPHKGGIMADSWNCLMNEAWCILEEMRGAL